MYISNKVHLTDKIDHVTVKNWGAQNVADLRCYEFVGDMS